MIGGASPARALWEVVEPYHALVYFAPEARSTFEDVGLRGFWRGYFAGRASPLGLVGPDVVTAIFFGFHPDFVARAIPDVWDRCAPVEALDARLAAVDAAVRSHLDAAIVADVARAALPELRRLAMSGDPAGRPLYAANRALDEPDDPHLALWHLATLVRERRGDGHIAALVARDIAPVEAHLLRIAVSGLPLESVAPYRGWTDDDWDAAAASLRTRGWLDAAGRATPAGRVVHDGVERDTDAAALPPDAEPAAVAQVVARLAPVASTLADDVVPYPNPIGLPRPGARQPPGGPVDRDGAAVPPLVAEDHVCSACGLSYAELTVTDAVGIVAALPTALRAAVAAVPAARRAVRPDERTWSVAEYACHLRDALMTGTIRLHRATTEDVPVVGPMLNELRARRFGYAHADVDAVLDQVDAVAAGFVAEVGDVARDRWDRRVIRRRGESRTARWLVRHAAHEARHHLVDVRRVAAAVTR
jgi:hypothetical protein